MGQLECDDGNSQSGDGCDSNCRVEDGYQCYRSEGQPDYCRSVELPTARMKVKEGNLIEITFKEQVKSDLNSIFSIIKSNLHNSQ